MVSYGKILDGDGVSLARKIPIWLLLRYILCWAIKETHLFTYIFFSASATAAKSEPFLTPTERYSREKASCLSHPSLIFYPCLAFNPFNLWTILCLPVCNTTDAVTVDLPLILILLFILSRLMFSSPLLAKHSVALNTNLILSSNIYCAFYPGLWISLTIATI